MKIATPRTMQGPLTAAYAQAVEAVEPVFVPAPAYADDRGWSIMNQFQGVLSAEGQVNYAVIYPGTIKAWHRHRHQTDYWLCVGGHLKVGIHREADGATWSIVTGEKRLGIVIIPPPLWHGVATVSHEPAAMFYYVTKAFDTGSPDEDRRAYDSVAGFPWATEHR